MHTAAHWVILATLASLTHRAIVNGQVGEEKEQQPSQLSASEEKERQLINKYSGCCNPEKALPPLFQADADSCLPSNDKIINDDPAAFAAAAKEMCVVQCILGKNGMLNDNLSIKEKELKELFKGKADPSVGPVLQDALDKCFDQHNKKTDKGARCASGAEPLFDCLSYQILVNCPEQIWNNEKEECKGIRGTLKSDQ